MTPSSIFSEIDRNILIALSRGSRSTPELKQLVGQSAYRRCRRLADLGLLQSTSGVGHVLFCIECWTAVTQENHQDHEDHEDQIRNIANKICVWTLTDKGQQEILSFYPGAENSENRDSENQ